MLTDKRTSCARFRVGHRTERLAPVYHEDRTVVVNPVSPNVASSIAK
jgi:hypothetical protein